MSWRVSGLILGSVRSPAELLFLVIFLGSTPVSAFAVYALGSVHREWWAIANTYGFAGAYCLLYLWPLLSPARGAASLAERVDAATHNWIVWLSCFTQIAFQIPHNLCTATLASSRGSLLEWPFYAYGLSDARWAAYTTRWPDGRTIGLPPEVWLINVNDASFGAVVLWAFVRARSHSMAPHSMASHKARILLALVLMWRDATLFRETVEYLMLQHHGTGYIHTVTGDSSLRPHAIVCLWLINGLWLVCPVLSALWAWNVIMRAVASKQG
jgi:hypothetical protein